MNNGHLNNLVLLLDDSGSMTQSLHPGLPAKYKQMNEETEKLLNRISSMVTRILVYKFGDNVSEIYDGKSTKDALDEIQIMDHNSGGTRIWDALIKVKNDLISKGIEKALVICITDGEDYGSGFSREQATAQYPVQGERKLKVIILNEIDKTFDDNEKDDYGIVEHIQDFSEIHRIIEPGKDRFVNINEAQINAPVLLLSKDNAELLEEVKYAMNKVVPFIERLTDLRYYPVPTLIVDRRIAKQLGIVEKPLASRLNGNPSETLIEVSKLITAVSITYHTSSFGIQGDKLNPDVAALRDELTTRLEDDYSYYLSSYSPKLRRIIRFAAEVGFDVNKIGKEKRAVEISLERALLSELSIQRYKLKKEPVSPVLFFYLAAVEKVLQRLKMDFGDMIGMYDGYFCHGRIKTDLNKWRSYCTNEEMGKLEPMVDRKGEWIINVDNMATAYSIAIKVVRRALRDLERVTNKYIKVIDELRLYGCYLPPNNQNDTKIEKILSRAGMPLQIGYPKSGCVLIYSDVCKESVGLEADSERIVDSDLWPNILETVLCHEHCHAASIEGLNPDYSNNTTILPIDTSKKTIVSEALAEWSEIELVRDAPKMLEIVMAHVKNGVLPVWPYEGALYLEGLIQQQGLNVYKEILTNFRAGNVQEAYKRLLPDLV